LQDTKELRKIKGLHRDLFANLPTHFLSVDRGGRTNENLLTRPFRSPAVWGSRGSTELLNGEKKTRRSGEVLTSGRDAGRWPNSGAAGTVVGIRRTFGSNRTDRESEDKGH
jgi:hypothetical protein